MRNIDNKDCKKKVLPPSNVKYIGIVDTTGGAELITVRNTKTANPGEMAQVIDSVKRGKHVLDFVIPRGYDGTSFTILGHYDDINELQKEHPVGNIGDAYIVDGNLYIWADNTNTWDNVGQIRGPKGDKGEQGEQGPPGVNMTRASYVVTFNDGTSVDGIPVPSSAKLPLDRVEFDDSNLIKLDTDEETIKFNELGLYKITFTVSAYPLVNGVDFDPTTDIVALGFKETNTDNVYVGVSQFVYNGEPVQLVGQGIVSVVDTNATYELSNLSPKTIYLETPDIRNLTTVSYFTNSLVTIVIEYLGKSTI